ncbi:hypothetical protein PGT21_001502 [Puccinia graminis f. sp. tritici]|nr:hypothetical protein PGT21_001502 [Puccinia graminis f. sp. tritici]
MLKLKLSNLLIVVIAACQLFRSASCNQFHKNFKSQNLRRREVPFGNPNSNYANRNANDGYGPSTGRGNKVNNVPGQAGGAKSPGSSGPVPIGGNVVNAPNLGGILPGSAPGVANGGIGGSLPGVTNSGGINTG